jgi:hypothetical protein
MKTNVETPWDVKDRRKRRAGLAEAQIQKWETKHGVRLPRVLREALRQQNGGALRYSDVSVYALDGFKLPDEEFWEYASYNKRLFRDVAKVFFFAEGESGCTFLLNFKEKGPRDEPTVWYYYSDPGDVRRQSRAVKDFFDSEMAVDTKPKVNWSETEKLNPLLHQETIEQPLNKRMVWRRTHVLGRLHGRLIHFLHEVDGEQERLVRTVIPEPLDREWASINTPDNAGHRGPFEYHLQPVDSKRMQEVESVRKASGAWKNRTGAGVWVGVESASESKLQALRATLLGKAGARKASTEDQKQAEFARSVMADPKKAVEKATRTAFDLIQSSMAELDELIAKLPEGKPGGGRGGRRSGAP